MSKEVYIAYGKNKEVLYVGQGNIGRHKHCVSGVSHVYELNKMHFNNEEVLVKVHLITNSKDEALNVEKQLILELKPKFNTVHSVYKADTTQVIRLKSDLDNEVKSFYAKHRKRHEALVYLKHAEYLINTLGYKNLVQGISLPTKFFRDNFPYFYKVVKDRNTHKNTVTDLWLLYEVKTKCITLKLFDKSH